ncbi:Phosphatidylinositol (PI) 3-kinase [Irineochytrium annulatum]|nr:Phosphatidylinositol (PI) 3-kinase [Irineochytrium annulatum]
MEALRDNPVENKHRKLARSHRNGPLDRDLKPNAKLRDELNALTKFLKCVVWTDAVEERQAVELLALWVDIDVEDALELLGLTFENRHVRSYAVQQLKKADDEELQLYLLQLVQALKFEGIGDKGSVHESPLADFLIDRAIKNPILGNYFYWYLMVECEDKSMGKMFAKVVYQFMTSMIEIPDGINRHDTLRRQAELIASLAKISKEIRNMKDARPKKVHVTGIVAEKALVFKSALQPLRLTFLCLDGTEYPVIFKTGDDLRQDQLVIQIITLMDKLLRKENLDLRLTPYKVLATGSDHGIVQFIPSAALATILAENGNNVTAYLKEHNSGDSGVPSAIPVNVMDNYIRSCAGYCVITYLLGIGDRHLDNLLLTTNGNLFHIDFGFILGRDPKPFPPPMKLSKEMIEVMGGADSPAYQRFKSFCFIAFNSLRKSANLIFNLFSLMVNANVPDIAIEPDKAVLKGSMPIRT